MNYAFGFQLVRSYRWQHIMGYQVSTASAVCIIISASRALLGASSAPIIRAQHDAVTTIAVQQWGKLSTEEKETLGPTGCPINYNPLYSDKDTKLFSQQQEVATFIILVVIFIVQSACSR
jgi:hypothetical protein